ncbi:MAG: CAP domain-containing protein [Paludisphaera borealis]|uniref:CAP domain-containing protein n=1 Tax=Paludisphaera borealis TaxID=1387353 RepID=UPI0028429DEA|nr:CAP domain-containing protein [Paludisphaera borealis]MDR3619372.1 CAP domain-containing protein [Paludisphaera borealis]
MNAELACMLCLVFPPAQQTPPSATTVTAREAPGDPDADRLNFNLLEAHNRARADAKLPPLTIDAKLTTAARRHADDMAEQEKMSHEGSDGSTPDVRVKRAGYHYVRTGENIAAGQKGVDQVLEAWLESPGHKANILGPFTQMGAARVIDESGEPYWCVEFGEPILRLNPAEAAAKVVENLNAARKEAGAAPLEVDAKLAGVARKMAVAAAEADTLHPEKADQPEKQELPDLVQLMKKAGVSFSKLNQSMASGNPTADDVVKSLLRNEKQKEMLLGPFKTVGIGYANGSDDTPFWCVLVVEP